MRGCNVYSSSVMLTDRKINVFIKKKKKKKHSAIIKYSCLSRAVLKSPDCVLIIYTVSLISTKQWPHIRTAIWQKEKKNYLRTHLTWSFKQAETKPFMHF